MKFILMSILFFSAEWVLACGSSVGLIQPGEKAVGIQLTPLVDEGKGPSWVMDDDGILVMGLVASSCYRDLPSSRVQLTESQSKCVDALYSDPKRNIPVKERISFTRYSKGFEKLEDAQKLLKSTCDIDASALWKEVNDKVNQMDLPCAANTRQIYTLVSKAATRFDEYFTQQMADLGSGFLNMSDENEVAHRAQLHKQKAVSEAMKNLFSSSPVKMGAFKDWLDDYRSSIEETGYQVVKSPNMYSRDLIDPDKLVPIETILVQLGSRMLDYFSPCASPIPSDIIERLSTVVWLPKAQGRKNNGGTQNGKKQTH